MKIACVGDLCVDIYSNRDNLMLVGGNSILVAAAVRGSGMDSSFVGFVGEDEIGRVALQQLNDHGIDTSAVQIRPGKTAWTEVILENNDRIFQDEDLGVSKQFQLTDEAFSFIAGHDLIHFTAFTNWPTAPKEIPDYYTMVQQHTKRFQQTGLPLSVDFSDTHDEVLFESIKGLVTIAILSRSELTEAACRELAQELHQTYDFPLVVITRGDQGSIAYDGQDFYAQPCVKVEVVDPLGAGDSFAGSFLVAYLNKQPLPTCLQLAASYAAQVCTRFGGF